MQTPSGGRREEMIHSDRRLTTTTHSQHYHHLYARRQQLAAANKGVISQKSANEDIDRIVAVARFVLMKKDRLSAQYATVLGQLLCSPTMTSLTA